MNVTLAQYLDGLRDYPPFENFETISARTVAKCGDTALHYAVIQGNTEIVVLLLTAGADPNQREKKAIRHFNALYCMMNWACFLCCSMQAPTSPFGIIRDRMLLRWPNYAGIPRRFVF